MTRKTSILALALLVVSAVTAAQEAEEATFEDEMVVSEVLLDALVTDSDDRVILGLNKDDFTVLENGRPVETLGVSFYSSQERVASDRAEIPGFDLSDIPEDRQFIIFVQDAKRASSRLNNLYLRQQRAGRDLVKWVNGALQPADVVAVVSYDHKLKVHQDFTRDRTKLTKAIENAIRGVDPDSQWPSRQPPESEIGPLRRALPKGKELRKATGNIYKGRDDAGEGGGDRPGAQEHDLHRDRLRPDPELRLPPHGSDAAGAQRRQRCSLRARSPPGRVPPLLAPVARASGELHRRQVLLHVSCASRRRSRRSPRPCRATT